MIGSEINEQSSLIRLIASREPDRTRSDISVTIASPHEDVGDHVGACWGPPFLPPTFKRGASIDRNPGAHRAVQEASEMETGQMIFRPLSDFSGERGKRARIASFQLRKCL